MDRQNLQKNYDFTPIIYQGLVKSILMYVMTPTRALLGENGTADNFGGPNFSFGARGSEKTPKNSVQVTFGPETKNVARLTLITCVYETYPKVDFIEEKKNKYCRIFTRKND